MNELDSHILGILPTARSLPRWISTSDIRDALRRSGIETYAKKVQRRLDAFAEQGLVVRRAAGNALEWQKNIGAGGFASKAGGMMTLDEALALRTLDRFAGAQLPHLVRSALSGLFQVANDMLARGVVPDAHRYANWQEKVAVVASSVALAQPAIGDAILPAVSQALFSERWLEVAYRAGSNMGGPPKCHVLMPLGLVSVEDLIYLVAMSDSESPPFLYRLDRMVSANVHVESFSYPRDFVLSRYIHEGKHLDFLPQGKIKLVLRFNVDYCRSVMERPLAEDQQVSDVHDGWVRLQATVMLTERLRWWIRAFGPEVEVLEPPALRQEFAEEATRAYARYQGTV